MNKKIIFSFLFLLVTQFSFSQIRDTKYQLGMSHAIARKDSAKSMEDWQNVANNFERISGSEKKEWLPAYWASYCYIMMCLMDDDVSKVDGYCDIAEKFITQADSVSPNNSEIYVMRSFIYSSRIRVNPMVRGQQFGPLSGMALKTAIKLNPENPRAYMLDGEGKFYTPEAFGGGKDKAKPLLELSVQKFESFKPAGQFEPDWGYQHTKEMLAKCGQ